MNFNRMKNNAEDGYSKALLVIGWSYIVLGAIGSFVLASTIGNIYGEFNLTILISGLFVTALFGSLILGVAEIINILNDNRRLLATIAQGNESNETETFNINTIESELPEL